MNEQTIKTDRYISFEGINCDANSEHLITLLEQHITAGHGDERWHLYFTQKREEQARMQQDNLHFIGSQMNNLYAYLEQCEDDTACDLLWQIEQECC